MGIFLNPKVDSPPFAATVALWYSQADPVLQPLGEARHSGLRRQFEPYYKHCTKPCTQVYVYAAASSEWLD